MAAIYPPLSCRGLIAWGVCPGRQQTEIGVVGLRGNLYYTEEIMLRSVRSFVMIVSVIPACVYMF